MLKNIFYSVFRNKCPKCHKTSVFKSPNPYNFKEMSQMNEVCSNCSEKYEKEPGGYYGSMYVSYGLMAGWFILCWIFNVLVTQIELGYFLAFVCGTIVLLMPLTFRISRLIWINIFIKYQA